VTAELAAFLKARLDEDERTARAAIRDDPGHMFMKHSQPQEIAHIARHDPARVLRDVEAKRRIIDEHEPYEDITGYINNEPIRAMLCPTCVYIGDDETPDGDRIGVLEHDDAPCATLRLLALPYDQHPEYQMEWRPE
jgi:uncharacterized protein YlaI